MRHFFGTILLSAALLAPLTTSARADDQHDRDDRNRNQAQERNREGRYYDPYYRDYHNWTRQENQAYRRYLEERHEQYRDYERLNKKQQRDYWRWRHSHRDADDRR